MIFGSINRMIFVELMKVFLLSLTGLTGMFMIAGLIQEASQRGLSPLQIVMAIPLIIPNTLPYTIPATTLFATCIVYGRMSADNEVLVLRAAGVNIYHLLWPAAMLGILTTIATGALYYEIIPSSQPKLREQLFKDAEGLIYNAIKRDGGMNHSSMDFVIYVREVQGRDLLDVVLKKRKADRSGYELVARAQSARIRISDVPDLGPTPPPTPETPAKSAAKDKIYDDPIDDLIEPKRPKKVVYKKELVVDLKRCFVDSLKGGTAAEFKDESYGTPLPESLFGKDTKDRPSSQTWPELFDRRIEIAEQIAEAEATYAALKAKGSALARNGKTYADNAESHKAGPVTHYRRQMNNTNTEIQMRPALALGCMCFVLIGCPVGIWASRSDYLSIFIICFLPTMFLYYPLLMASLNMAKSGKAPAIMAWAADGLVFVCALVLVWRLMKR